MEYEREIDGRVGRLLPKNNKYKGIRFETSLHHYSSPSVHNYITKHELLGGDSYSKLGAIQCMRHYCNDCLCSSNILIATKAKNSSSGVVASLCFYSNPNPNPNTRWPLLYFYLELDEKQNQC